MTNSEAIQILQDTPIDVASTKRGILGLYAEALDMAIEALSAQPLSESDLLELEHRFGDYVRFVVEDMLLGEEKRWEKKI